MNVREKAKSGQMAAGTMIRTVRNPAVICIAKAAGLDFVMFDCEHGVFTTETLHDACMTALACGLEAYARVPVATKDYISRYLDCGISGIMAPMTETAEQAKNLVYYSKYPPVGGRGFTAAANTAYKGGKHSDVMQEANSRVMSIAQIETKLAVENCEEIAATPGIDALVIGPNDLSIDLGIAGDMTNPMEIEAIKKVAAACKKHGKLFTVHAKPEYQNLFKGDLSFIMQMGDTDIIADGFKKIKAYAENFR
jgi:2-keto-3-deoxy-L-rhamnonate aldolase RhmA